MKKILIATGLCVGLFMVESAFADGLKNVLSKKLHTQESTPGMVNLDALNTPRSVKPKSRPSKAVVAIVNGHKIIKKEADTYLSKRTKGKISDFDLLPAKQRLALIKEMSLPRLLSSNIQKELSEEEKKAVLSRIWLAQKIKDANITASELQEAYAKIKAQAKAKNVFQQVPPFETIKERLKAQVVQQQIVDDLMKGASIRPASGEDGIAGYVGMMAISLEDANKALQMMTKKRMSWSTLPISDKKRVLQMVAPVQFIALAAKNDLTDEQKKRALTNYWMQKSISKISVTDKEAKKLYKKLKKRVQGKKKLADYASLEKTLKMQVANEKFIKQVIQKAHIKLK